MSAANTGFGRTVAVGCTWEKASNAEKAWIADHDPEAFDAMLADFRSRRDGRPFAECLRAVERERARRGG